MICLILRPSVGCSTGSARHRALSDWLNSHMSFSPLETSLSCLAEVSNLNHSPLKTLKAYVYWSKGICVNWLAIVMNHDLLSYKGDITNNLRARQTNIET